MPNEELYPGAIKDSHGDYGFSVWITCGLGDERMRTGVTIGAPDEHAAIGRSKPLLDRWADEHCPHLTERSYGCCIVPLWGIHDHYDEFSDDETDEAEATKALLLALRSKW